MENQTHVGFESLTSSPPFSHRWVISLFEVIYLFILLKDRNSPFEVHKPYPIYSANHIESVKIFIIIMRNDRFYCFRV